MRSPKALFRWKGRELFWEFCLGLMIAQPRSPAQKSRGNYLLDVPSDKLPMLSPPASPIFTSSCLQVDLSSVGLLYRLNAFHHWCFLSHCLLQRFKRLQIGFQEWRCAQDLQSNNNGSEYEKAKQSIRQAGFVVPFTEGKKKNLSKEISEPNCRRCSTLLSQELCHRLSSTTYRPACEILLVVVTHWRFTSVYQSLKEYGQQQQSCVSIIITTVESNPTNCTWL